MSEPYLQRRHKIWRKILDFLVKSNEPRHSKEVAEEVGITPDSAYYRLHSLAAEGLVEMLRKPYGILLWTITDKGKQWLKEQH